MSICLIRRILHLLEYVLNYIWIQQSSRKKTVQSGTSYSKCQSVGCIIISPTREAFLRRKVVLSERPFQVSVANWHEKRKTFRLISVSLNLTTHPLTGKKKEHDSSLVTHHITPSSSFRIFSIIFYVHHLAVSPNLVWLHTVFKNFFYPF